MSDGTDMYGARTEGVTKHTTYDGSIGSVGVRIRTIK